MMLVSPGGQNATIMSDAGGSNDLVGCDLTLDDEARSRCPTSIRSSALAATMPADYEPGDPFPAPAPTPSGNVTLSTFNGGTAERDLVAVHRR